MTTYTETDADCKKVFEIIKIYLNKAIAEPTNSPEKIQSTRLLFEYLLLADVKMHLLTPPFEKTRNKILTKIIEFKAEPYLQNNAKLYYHFIASLDEMQTFLQFPDQRLRRRSERLKHKFIATMNETIQDRCICADCIMKVAKLKNALYEAKNKV